MRTVIALLLASAGLTVTVAPAAKADNQVEQAAVSASASTLAMDKGVKPGATSRLRQRWMKTTEIPADRSSTVDSSSPTSSAKNARALLDGILQSTLPRAATRRVATITMPI